MYLWEAQRESSTRGATTSRSATRRNSRPRHDEIRGQRHDDITVTSEVLAVQFEDVGGRFARCLRSGRITKAKREGACGGLFQSVAVIFGDSLERLRADGRDELLHALALGPQFEPLTVVGDRLAALVFGDAEFVRGVPISLSLERAELRQGISQLGLDVLGEVRRSEPGFGMREDRAAIGAGLWARRARDAEYGRL